MQKIFFSSGKSRKAWPRSMSHWDLNETSQETLKRISRDISRESQENLIEISMRSQWDVSLIILEKYLISRGSDYWFGSGQGCGGDYRFGSGQDCGID